MGLGPLHTVDLAAARQRAKQCRLLLIDGINPLTERRASQTATNVAKAKRTTFDKCAAAYIDAHRGSWKNAAHVSQWENTIASYASPLIGALPVPEVDTDLVVKVLSPIWRKKTESEAPPGLISISKQSYGPYQLNV